MKTYYTEREFAAITAVCSRIGMRPGAWIADLAVRYARGVLEPIPLDWRDMVGELSRWRVDVVRAGTVVNQVARHANATGTFEEETSRLLALVERLLTRVDDATEQASQQLRGRS